MATKIASLYAEIGVNITNLKKGLTDAKTGLSGLAKDLTTSILPAATLAGAITAIGAAAKKSIDDTMKYNLSIRDLAQNLGITTEATSRLIQTADDYGISQETVTSALQMATRKGFAPTVETIAKLADEYVALETPTAKAARMFEVFGRNWQALTPMLREGGQAIRDAAAAQADALVVTEKNAQAARDYFVALDALGDSMTAVKYTAGNALIPSLTELANNINKNVSEALLMNDALNKLETAYKLGAISADYFNNSIGRDFGNLENYNLLIEDLDKKMNRINYSSGPGVQKALENVDEVTGNVVQETVKLKDGTERVVTSFVHWGKVTDDQVGTLYDLEKAEIAAAKAQETMQSKFDLLTTILEGPVGSAQKQFIQDMKDAREKLADLQYDLKHAKTFKQRNEIKLDIEDAKEKIDELEAAYEEQTNRMILDMAIQEAAMDGVITQQDYDKIANLGKYFGLWDEATATAVSNVKGYMADGGESVTDFAGKIRDPLITSEQEAMNKALAFREQWAEIKNKTVTLTTKYVYTGNRDYTGEQRQKAAGGPYVAGMPILVGEKGPEILVPSTSGYVIPNNQAVGGGSPLGGNTYYSYEINNYNAEAAAFNMAYIKHQQLSRLNGRMGA